MQKPSLPKGTRDFAPEVMVKRNYILNTIRVVFEKFGFQPLETPSMENLEVLTGKYGEEGDQLIFKILNSGDFLSETTAEDKEDYKTLIPKISEKALRYDLTVPFARFVTMNRGVISFPFKRYQIQPVWRGDRPQRGRYREFYQCDADVVGTDSLICEAEIVLMINEVLGKLGIQNFALKINNRKILSGIAEYLGYPDRVSDMCVAIDKLDKIGEEKVLEELSQRGFNDTALKKISPVIALNGSYSEKIIFLKQIFASSEIGQKGLAELGEVIQLLKQITQKDDCIETLHIDFDQNLARGLSYYTGAIFEVKALNVSIGSISGGGRYDDLTGAFGMPDTSGVGFSFGVDRIYDVMEELNVFPEENTLSTTQVMFTNFDEVAQKYLLPMVAKFREADIRCEIYPDSSKLKKQMNYANRKNIPYVILAGEEEIQAGKITLKNMLEGNQELVTLEEAILKIKA